MTTPAANTPAANTPTPGRVPTMAEQHAPTPPGSRLVYVVRRFEVAVPVMVPVGLSDAEAVVAARTADGLDDAIDAAIREGVKFGELEHVAEAVCDEIGDHIGSWR